MLKKILVALDGSENAERALWWATTYARREKALILLFRAVDPSGLVPAAVPSLLTDARNYLQRMEADIHQAGLPARAIVRQGRPALAITRTAIEERCDLILMTTRGGSKVKRWTIGGVTEQVLRMSPVPVMPVQTRTRPAKNDHIRRVIVPVDGSRLAEAVNPWAAGLARLLRAQLVFLHVYPATPVALRQKGGETYDLLQRRLNRLCRQLKKTGVKARLAVRAGDAAERILAFAKKSDLIVTTTHGEGGFKRWIFGSVAEKLIHESRNPVLVYKTFSQIRDNVLTA